MNIFAFFRNEIIEILKGLPLVDNETLDRFDISTVVVEPSRHDRHGDIITNAALVVARATGMPAMMLVNALSQALQDHPFVASCAVEAPGFLNVTLEGACLRGTLKDNLLSQDSYGYSDVGKGEAVTIESPTVPTTDSIHLGCYWAAAQGDVLITLLQMLGYSVHRSQLPCTDSANAVTRIHRGNTAKVLSAPTHYKGSVPSEYANDVRVNQALYFLLTHPKGVRVNSFDALWEITKEASVSNPLFSIHFAVVRINAVKRHINMLFPESDLSSLKMSEINLEGLNASAERLLIKLLAQWPYQLERACVTLETQRIALYLSTVAEAFHQLWNNTEEMAELHFVYPSDVSRTCKMYALLQGVLNIITAGLRLYKITPLEDMNGCM